MDIGNLSAVMLHFTPLDLFLAFFLMVVIPVQSALTGRTLARTPRSELQAAMILHQPAGGPSSLTGAHGEARR